MPVRRHKPAADSDRAGVPAVPVDQAGQAEARAADRAEAAPK